VVKAWVGTLLGNHHEQMRMRPHSNVGPESVGECAIGLNADEFGFGMNRPGRESDFASSHLPSFSEGAGVGRGCCPEMASAHDHHSDICYGLRVRNCGKSSTVCLISPARGVEASFSKTTRNKTLEFGGVSLSNDLTRYKMESFYFDLI
jgi:hypothetical protein